MTTHIDGATGQSDVPPLLSKKDVIEAVVYISLMAIVVGFVTPVNFIFVAIAGVVMLIPVLGLMMLGNHYRRRKELKERS